MQLKRDCDYALRLLLRIVNQGERTDGIKLSELCKDTSVPRTIAARLCQKMQKEHLIEAVNPEEAEMRYQKSETVLDKTLFELIEIFEGRAELFAIFGKSTRMYRRCGETFEMLEDRFAALLKSVTVRKLVEQEKEEWESGIEK